MESSSSFYLQDENYSNVVYRGKVNWSCKSFSITVLNENTAQKGTMPEELVTEHSRLLNIPEKKYLDECREAFNCKSIPNCYFYSLEDKQFIIKKKLENESGSSVKIKFASIHLVEVDLLKAINELLDFAWNQSNHYVSQIKILSEKKQDLELENCLAVTRIKKMQEEKNTLEHTLCKKFLNLLNSKKEYYASEQNEQGITEGGSKTGEKMIDQKESLVDGLIFDVDTDIDDADEINNHVLNESDQTWSGCREHLFHNRVNETRSTTSKIENIYNSMAFLDPTVPFSDIR